MNGITDIIGIPEIPKIPKCTKFSVKKFWFVFPYFQYFLGFLGLLLKNTKEVVLKFRYWIFLVFNTMNFGIYRYFQYFRIPIPNLIHNTLGDYSILFYQSYCFVFYCHTSIMSLYRKVLKLLSCPAWKLWKTFIQ